MTIPNKLLVLSDDNELEYVRTVTHDERGKKIDATNEYKYTKSVTKLGFILQLSITDIENKIKNKIFDNIL